MRAELAFLWMVFGATALPAQTQPPVQAPSAGVGVDSLRQNRADLERRVRERMAQVTQKRLGATDEQMTSLQATNRKFDDLRRTLVDQERNARVSLRYQMQHPDPAGQQQVSALLDRVIQVQRQRAELQEQEQKEIAGYLTPLQRAKYFALEQQIRQRVTQLRQMQPARGARAGRGQLQPARKEAPGRGGKGVQPRRPRQ